MVSIGMMGAQREARAVVHIFPSGNSQRIWGVGGHFPQCVWSLVLVSRDILSHRSLVHGYELWWTWVTSADKENPLTSWRRTGQVMSCRCPAHQHWAEPEMLQCHTRESLFASCTAKAMSENCSEHVSSSAANSISTWAKDRHRDPEFKERPDKPFQEYIPPHQTTPWYVCLFGWYFSILFLFKLFCFPGYVALVGHTMWLLLTVVGGSLCWLTPPSRAKPEIYSTQPLTCVDSRCFTATGYKLFSVYKSDVHSLLLKRQMLLIYYY